MRVAKGLTSVAMSCSTTSEHTFLCTVVCRDAEFTRNSAAHILGMYEASTYTFV